MYKKFFLSCSMCKLRWNQQLLEDFYRSPEKQKTKKQDIISKIECQNKI